MKTKTYRFKILLLINVLINLFCLSSEDNWVIASEQFVFSQKNKASVSNEAITKTLPSLILEQMSDNMTRIPRSQERLDRILYDLRKDRISYFLTLSQKVQERDSIVLKNYSSRRLKRELKSKNKEVSSIEKQIRDNLNQVQEETDKRRHKIEADDRRRKRMDEGEIIEEVRKQEDFFSSFFAPGKDEEEEIIENVTLYQNDYTRLFNAGSEAKNLGYESYAYEKACVDAKINALMTGKLTVYGNYLSCSVSLYQYPGSRLIASAMEVGTTQDLSTIATSIAMQLVPKIADSMPVELHFTYTPVPSSEVMVSIDDVMYPDIHDFFTVPSGVHTITFQAKGYTSESTSYNFKGNRRFNINVDFKEYKEGYFNLALKKPLRGDLYANGVLYGSVNETNRFSSIKVNNRPLLGYFVEEGGLRSDFFIDSKLMEEDINLMVKASPFDRSKYIDTRRKWMYGYYSALIVSCVPLFYTFGNYQSAVMAYNSSASDISREKCIEWQNAWTVCACITGGLATCTVYELIRYLRAANTVLPANAKKMSHKQKARIEQREQKARIEEKARMEERENSRLNEELNEIKSDGESNG